MSQRVLLLLLALLTWPLSAQDSDQDSGDEAAEPVVHEATILEPAAFEPAAWHAAKPEQPAVVIVRGATVWTSGPQGRLEEADVLIRAGKIVEVGQGLDAPSGATVIDGAGKHVTAGIVDAHSHTAISGGVNEGSNIVTSEVRIADVVFSDDIGIYRQLAGGVTTANLLHGSANSIGGQNAIIKLRWGAPASGLLFVEAPQGIKFALGENPKQSNWGVDNQRYPQTRQGVEQSIRERFAAALDYQREWQAYEKAGGASSQRVPPRKDLQLDAVLEIIEGDRLVHSHCYRADEIVMLLDIAEDYGFTVASFQHVLEGYKVADEIAAAGAGASTFSDWWAFKYEVVDAIPWNGAILEDRGVVTSFNSDSDELARRLNLEAAKAVRYGGVEPSEALKFVTLNPAIQLGIDQWVGSLEAGKHADFVVWSGSPLSTYSLVLETWVDGRKYFDRAADLAARELVANERQALMEKVRDLKDAGSDEGDEADPEDSAPPISRHAHDVHPHQESYR